jgi:hypothetical protein
MNLDRPFCCPWIVPVRLAPPHSNSCSNYDPHAALPHHPPAPQISWAHGDRPALCATKELLSIPSPTSPQPPSPTVNPPLTSTPPEEEMVEIRALRSVRQHARATRAWRHGDHGSPTQRRGEAPVGEAADMERAKSDSDKGSRLSHEPGKYLHLVCAPLGFIRVLLLARADSTPIQSWGGQLPPSLDLFPILSSHC